MRLLIPYRFVPISMKGGIDEVACGVIAHLPALVEEVRVQPSLGRYRAMRGRIPRARNLRFHPRPWLPDRPWLPSNESVLQRLAKRCRSTHCLYFFTRFQPPPRLDIPIYGLVHDLWWRTMPCSAELRAREDENLRRWLGACAGMFVPSEAVRGQALEVGPEFASKIHVIPHGFEPPPMRAKTAESAPPAFYYPAQFKANKRHQVLLEAARRLAADGHEFQLEFTGQHSERIASDELLDDMKLEPVRQLYQEHAELLADRVSARGFVEPSVVEDLYGSCRAVVLPTVFEGFGLPLLEALARGKPVICSDIGVFRELADRFDCHEFVRFFPPNDSVALAERMAERLELGPAPAPSDETLSEVRERTWARVAAEYVEAMA